MAVKEFKEFFLRNTKVTTGTKPDQETNFVTQYLVKGILTFNRFLRNNVPSEAVIRKLFDSITFKLNKEDTASTTIQGLVKKATDTNAEARLLNPSSDFTLGVVPHQLPEIVLSTDGNDAVVGSPVEQGGLKLSILRRTLSGLFRKNYKIEVNVDHSIVIDGTSKKLKLFADESTPGFNKFYGTDEEGIKGWRSPAQTTVYLREDFSSNTQTLDNIVGGEPLRFIFVPGVYKFNLILFIRGLKTLGIKVGAAILSGPSLDYLRMSLNYTTPTDGLVFQTTLLNLSVPAEGDGLDGVVVIDGTFEAIDDGTIAFQFAKHTGIAGTITVEKGSYMTYERIR